jgi:hypothetical protein
LYTSLTKRKESVPDFLEKKLNSSKPEGESRGSKLEPAVIRIKLRKILNSFKEGCILSKSRVTGQNPVFEYP